MNTAKTCEEYIINMCDAQKEQIWHLKEDVSILKSDLREARRIISILKDKASLLTVKDGDKQFISFNFVWESEEEFEDLCYWFDMKPAGKEEDEP